MNYGLIPVLCEVEFQFILQGTVGSYAECKELNFRVTLCFRLKSCIKLVLNRKLVLKPSLIQNIKLSNVVCA